MTQHILPVIFKGKHLECHSVKSSQEGHWWQISRENILFVLWSCRPPYLAITIYFKWNTGTNLAITKSLLVKNKHFSWKSVFGLLDDTKENISLGKLYETCFNENTIHIHFWFFSCFKAVVTDIMIKKHS